MSAVASGIVVASLSHPADTIKTCQQGDLAGTLYTSVGHTARALYRQGGILRFFSGWQWRTARTILELFLIDNVKEHLAPVLFPHHV